MTAILRLSDGTKYVDLINGPFYLASWRPAIAGYKGGGVSANSPIVDGSYPTFTRYENAVESIELKMRGKSQDDAYYSISRLMALVKQSVDYWTGRTGIYPVYLEAKSTSETYTRYAIIRNASLVDVENPYAMPFLQSECAAVMDGLILTVERGHWLEGPPGYEACQPVIVPVATAVPYSDAFNVAGVVLSTAAREPLRQRTPAIAVWPLYETSGTTAANVSNYSGLDGTYSVSTLDNLKFLTNEPAAYVAINSEYVDIYSAALNQRFNGASGTAFIWVSNSGPMWTAGFEHYFLNIGVDSTNRVFIRKGATDDTIEFGYRSDGVYGSTGATVSYSVSDDTRYWDRWFSLAITWYSRYPGVDEVTIVGYFDGSAVGSASTRNPAFSGSLGATQCTIGADDTTATYGAASTLAYAALWDVALPARDISYITRFPYSRTVLYGEEEDDSCNGSAYIANRYNRARITHIFVEDNSGGTFTGNRLEAALPYDLFPATAAANDAVYFGVVQESDSGLPASPFASIALDLTTAGVGTYTITWEYYNGSWTSLASSNLQDNSSGFTEGGPVTVHWHQPSDWTTNTVNTSYTGYWVRAKISAFTSMTTVPEQGNRQPYTITWNTIRCTDVGGDLPSLIRLNMPNVSHDGGTTISDTHMNRVVVGLRSGDRGEDFQSFIPIADNEQLPPGLSVFAGTGASFQNDTTSVAGRSLRLAVGSAAVITRRFYFLIDRGVSASYHGDFAAYIIYTAQATIDATQRIALGVRMGGANSALTLTPPKPYDSLATSRPYSVHEFGKISIRRDSFVGDLSGDIYLEVHSTGAITQDIDFFALVLIPVDEWSGDFWDQEAYNSGTASSVTLNRAFDIDSIRNPRKIIDTSSRGVFDESVSVIIPPAEPGGLGQFVFIPGGAGLRYATYSSATAGPAIIGETGEQALHVLMMKSVTGGSAVGPWIASLFHGAAVRLYRQRRYLTPRGSR